MPKPNNFYKNLILTKHAVEKFSSRKISVDSIYQTVNYPDKKEKIIDHKVKFYRKINNRRIQVIAVYKSDEKKWLVVSAWVRGEEDRAPFVWTIISLPFKLLFWLLKKILYRRFYKQK